MTRKFFAVFLILIFYTTNTNASDFSFIFSRFFTVPTFSEDSEPEIIYCDTVGHWCSYAAERLYKEEIFTGIKIGKKYYFMPDEYITRGEFLLYLDAVLETPVSDTTVLPFADTKSIPGWQLSTVRSMYERGYIKGNMERKNLFFNHDEKISRLECAIILNNIIGLENTVKSTDYYDNYLIPQYAVTAVKNVSDFGLMQGYEDNSFRPYIKINRAMLADILCKVKDYYQDKK